MSLINTRIQNVRANSRLDKNELRPSRYGALDLFMRQSEDPAGILTPELKEKAEKSIGNTLETPVIDYDGNVTIGNTRSVTIADDENTSQMYTITFATYSWGFTSVPAMFLNNEISMQRDFERKFNKYLYKFAETLDSAAIAALVAAKTQVFGDILNYTNVGNAVIAPWSQRENIVGDINPMLAANDHFNEIHVLGNAGFESLVRKLAQKDLYNIENKTLEYSDKILHFSTRLANAAGEFANMLAVNGGSVAMLARFERESLLRTKMADGTSWDIDTLPMINFPVGTYFYESKGDFSAIAGAATADLTRARKEHYGFAVDVAILTNYNSDPTTIANPIMKITVNDEATSDALKVQVMNTSGNPVYTQEVS
jgi:hypothetical protein